MCEYKVDLEHVKLKIRKPSMKMEVEIISKECIKPSSPTAHHLKTHKLSLLDLYLPPVYIPLVLYYPMDQQYSSANTSDDHMISTRLQLLKQSLSETLARFYPLAGKIKDLHSIECNDEGIYFIEARVKSPLDEFLNLPNISLIKEFLPDPADAKWRGVPTPGDFVASVQVTTFSCGGITIGAYVSHMIGDGTAFSLFLKSWAAATARKNYNEESEAVLLLSPKFDASLSFPQNDAFPRQACSMPLRSGLPIKFGRCICRRFLFDASAITNLKAKAKGSAVQNPTRVEVVTTLLGKCIMAALKAQARSSSSSSSSDRDSDKPFALIHAVNLRRRATPPFSENYMGNFIWMASALCKNEEEPELQGLVCQLREAIAKLNGDFVNSLQGDEGLLNFLEALKYERETYTRAADRIAYSSWCNFGFYEIDFGWGKPIWASVTGPHESSATALLNAILLMDTNTGNGIEAWVCLHEDTMAVLQVDQQLLQYAIMDPSPIKTNI